MNGDCNRLAMHVLLRFLWDNLDDTALKMHILPLEATAIPEAQPGVETYKKNMFALLGKPGYEAESEAIKSRL